LSVNRAVLMSAWPNNLGRAAGRNGDHQVRSSWRFIPEDRDELYDWATVVDDDAETLDGRVFKRLVYDASVLPADAEDGLFEVTLLLQGFMREHALSVLGNWSGRERDATQAMQFLKLDGGRFGTLFAAQRQALDNIRHLIHLHVGGEPVNADEDDQIVLRRPVFTKVRGAGVQAVGIALDDTNDPFGAARRISRRWRIDHAVETFVRRPNGSKMRVSPEALRTGDFVEATVTANIRILRSRKHRKTVVEFEMHEVVRLWSAGEVNVSFLCKAAGKASH
ncbi:hypothetical protein C2E23DRAFT_740110, partial [Lenzites betulinus]